MFMVLLGVMLSQDAQAFYNPSTGRWLSRDPVAEVGFKMISYRRTPNLHGDGLNDYAFVGNNNVNRIDVLGLMKWSEVVAFKDKLDAKVSKECCWFFCKSAHLQFDITGAASGETITAQAGPFPLTTCISKVFYFWWSCYDAVAEGPDNSTRQGWFPSGASFSRTQSPAFMAEYYDIFDPYNIDVQCAAVVILCVDGQKRAVLTQAYSELAWAWDKSNSSWNPPTRADKN